MESFDERNIHTLGPERENWPDVLFQITLVPSLYNYRVESLHRDLEILLYERNIHTLGSERENWPEVLFQITFNLSSCTSTKVHPYTQKEFCPSIGLMVPSLYSDLDGTF